MFFLIFSIILYLCELISYSISYLTEHNNYLLICTGSKEENEKKYFVSKHFLFNTSLVFFHVLNSIVKEMFYNMYSN